MTPNSQSMNSSFPSPPRYGGKILFWKMAQATSLGYFDWLYPSVKPANLAVTSEEHEENYDVSTRFQLLDKALTKIMYSVPQKLLKIKFGHIL